VLLADPHWKSGEEKEGSNASASLQRLQLKGVRDKLNSRGEGESKVGIGHSIETESTIGKDTTSKEIKLFKVVK